MDNSDTSGVDSSSLSPVGAGELTGAFPISRSFSFDSFSALDVGTGIVMTTSSLSVDVERLVLMGIDDEVVFSGMLFPMYLSSVDFDLNAGFGDGGGETNNEDGLVLTLLPIFFRVL